MNFKFWTIFFTFKGILNLSAGPPDFRSTENCIGQVSADVQMDKAQNSPLLITNQYQ